MIIRETILNSGIMKSIGSGARLIGKSAGITIGVVAGVTVAAFAAEYTIGKVQARRAKKAKEAFDKAAADAPAPTAEAHSPEPDPVDAVRESEAAVKATEAVAEEVHDKLNDAMDSLKGAASKIAHVAEDVVGAAAKVVDVTGAAFDLAGDRVAEVAGKVQDKVADMISVPGEEMSSVFNDDGTIVTQAKADIAQAAAAAAEAAGNDKGVIVEILDDNAPVDPEARAQAAAIVMGADAHLAPSAPVEPVAQVHVNTHAAQVPPADESVIAKAVKQATGEAPAKPAASKEAAPKPRPRAPRQSNKPDNK